MTFQTFHETYFGMVINRDKLEVCMSSSFGRVKATYRQNYALYITRVPAFAAQRAKTDRGHQ